MIRIDTDGERILIDADYAENNSVKTVPGASFRDKKWSAPLSWGTCLTLRGIFGQRLTIGPALTAWAQDVKQQVTAAMALRDVLDYPYGDERLYPFQRAGVAFLNIARSALLGDEMGSGKTVQTIVALREEWLSRGGKSSDTGLVVCPNSMKRTWAKELAKWWPECSPVLIDGTATQRRKELGILRSQAEEDDFIPLVGIINWESVRLHSRLAPYGSVHLVKCVACGGDDPAITEAKCETHNKELNGIPFAFVVADECHRLKDPKSKQTRAVFMLGRQAARRIALSGTPVADAPDDLWPVMHFTNPKDYPTKSKFVDRYALISWNAFGGMEVIGVRPDTREEFFSILDPQFRRMPKEATLPFLPKKTRIIRETPFSGAKQKKAYEQMRDNMLAEIEGDLITGTNSLTQSTRLIQFSSSLAEVTPDGSVVLTEPSNKLDELDLILEETAPASVVVFAQSRQLIVLAAARMAKQRIPYSLIIGGMTTDEREEHMEAFQQGKTRVILCTIAAGGVGITLTKSGIAVFLQRSWSMVDNKQAEDRVHRIGSEVHDKVTIIDLVTPGTVEEAQIEALEGKEGRLQEIVRDKALLAKLLKEGRMTDV